MKPLTEEEYVASGGNKCPSCGSGNLRGGGFEVIGTDTWQEVRCDDCQAKWHDQYKLVGYQLEE